MDAIFDPSSNSAFLKNFLHLLLFFSMPSLALAQDVTGLWRSYKEETGEPRAHVRMYVEEGKLYGQVVRSLQPETESSAICTECPKEPPFANYRDSMIGLVFIQGLQKNDDGRWVGDDALLDPDNGKTYDAKIWVPEDHPDQLKVRGFVGIFYRTQTWDRVEETSE